MAPGGSEAKDKGPGTEENEATASQNNSPRAPAPSVEASEFRFPAPRPRSNTRLPRPTQTPSATSITATPPATPITATPPRQTPRTPSRGHTRQRSSINKPITPGPRQNSTIIPITGRLRGLTASRQPLWSQYGNDDPASAATLLGGQGIRPENIDPINRAGTPAPFAQHRRASSAEEAGPEDYNPPSLHDQDRVSFPEYNDPLASINQLATPSATSTAAPENSASTPPFVPRHRRSRSVSISPGNIPGLILPPQIATGANPLNPLARPSVSTASPSTPRASALVLAGFASRQRAPLAARPLSDNNILVSARRTTLADNILATVPTARDNTGPRRPRTQTQPELPTATTEPARPAASVATAPSTANTPDIGPRAGGRSRRNTVQEGHRGFQRPDLSLILGTQGASAGLISFPAPTTDSDQGGPGPQTQASRSRRERR